MIKDVLSFRWLFTVNPQMFYELVFLIFGNFTFTSHVYCDILSRFSHDYGLLISQDLLTWMFHGLQGRPLSSNAWVTLFLQWRTRVSTSESQKCLLMQRALPVCSAMFQLCGCDFMSDSDGINIFFKSWLLVCLFFIYNSWPWVLCWRWLLCWWHPAVLHRIRIRTTGKCPLEGVVTFPIILSYVMTSHVGF